MIIALVFCVTLITVLFILLPLGKQPFWPQPAKTLLSEISRQKKMGIWAIADVDEEFEMGKLSPVDHGLLREYLKADLLSTMKQEKDLTSGGSRPEGKDIRLDLKLKLLSEVIRICGLKRS